jgi:hypothetical protein
MVSTTAGAWVGSWSGRAHRRVAALLLLGGALGVTAPSEAAAATSTGTVVRVAVDAALHVVLDHRSAGQHSEGSFAERFTNTYVLSGDVELSRFALGLHLPIGVYGYSQGLHYWNAGIGNPYLHASYRWRWEALELRAGLGVAVPLATSTSCCPEGDFQVWALLSEGRDLWLWERRFVSVVLPVGARVALGRWLLLGDARFSVGVPLDSTVAISPPPGGVPVTGYQGPTVLMDSSVSARFSFTPFLAAYLRLSGIFVMQRRVVYLADYLLPHEEFCVLSTEPGMRVDLGTVFVEAGIQVHLTGDTINPEGDSAYPWAARLRAGAEF